MELKIIFFEGLAFLLAMLLFIICLQQGIKKLKTDYFGLADGYLHSDNKPVKIRNHSTESSQIK